MEGDIMKFLCIDTNNLIFCSLLTQGNHTPESLEKLKMIVRENNSVKLLLPEVIKLEYKKRIDSAFTEKIGKKGMQIKQNIEEALPEHLEEKKRPLYEAVDQIISEREENKDKAAELFKEIIELSNTNIIDLTSEIIVEAEKRRIKALKPSKGRHKNDQDCYVIESLKSYLKKTEISGKLIFCTGDSDYTNEDQNKLHPDIIETFKEINIETKYYQSLPKMLTKEFETEISDHEIETINKIKENERNEREKIEDKIDDLEKKIKKLNGEIASLEYRRDKWDNEKAAEIKQNDSKKLEEIKMKLSTKKEAKADLNELKFNLQNELTNLKNKDNEGLFSNATCIECGKDTLTSYKVSSDENNKIYYFIECSNCGWKTIMR
jgi:DNA-directed RNA polymerase subunit RPC12/RpoP